jgi:uncharacterized BrkB/YihY/UPF0761 family membrane protein
VKYGLRYGSAFALALFSSVMVALLVVEKASLGLLGSLGARLPDALVWSIDIGTSVGLVFVLFTVLFRFLPETEVTLREASISAVVSTCLFALGSSGVTAYVRHKHMSDLYAGASTVVLAVVWVYYSAQVFFFGACVGAVLRARPPALVSEASAGDARPHDDEPRRSGDGRRNDHERRASS